jgi:hypothetical protein
MELFINQKVFVSLLGEIMNNLFIYGFPLSETTTAYVGARTLIAAQQELKSLDERISVESVQDDQPLFEADYIRAVSSEELLKAEQEVLLNKVSAYILNKNDIYESLFYDFGDSISHAPDCSSYPVIKKPKQQADQYDNII